MQCDGRYICASLKTPRLPAAVAAVAVLGPCRLCFSAPIVSLSSSLALTACELQQLLLHKITLRSSTLHDCHPRPHLSKHHARKTTGKTPPAPHCLDSLSTAYHQTSPANQQGVHTSRTLTLKSQASPVRFCAHSLTNASWS